MFKNLFTKRSKTSVSKPEPVAPPPRARRIRSPRPAPEKVKPGDGLRAAAEELAIGLMWIATNGMNLIEAHRYGVGPVVFDVLQASPGKDPITTIAGARGGEVFVFVRFDRVVAPHEGPGTSWVCGLFEASDSMAHHIKVAVTRWHLEHGLPGEDKR